MRVVVDSSVLTSALLSPRGQSREVLLLCLAGRCQPVMGEKLFCELEDVFGRKELFERCPVSAFDRRTLFLAFLNACEWTDVFFLWRPNLPDEGDNHIVELAVAGNAVAIVTKNVRDFRRGELRFPQVAVWKPEEFVKRMN